MKNTQFFKDMTDESKILNMYDGTIPLGYYNLLISIYDCKLYSKGIKPYSRNFKITNVKKYFGLKGDAGKLVVQLDDIKNALTNGSNIYLDVTWKVNVGIVTKIIPTYI